MARDNDKNQPTSTEALPDDLTELTDEQLDAAEQQARDEAQAIIDLDNPTPADLDRLDLLVGTEDAEGYLDRVDSQRAANVQAATELAERRQRAADRLNAEDADADTDAEDTAEDADTGTDADAEDADSAADADAAPEAVAASARRRGAAPMPRARRQPTPAKATKGMHTIVASADTGFAAGSQITHEQVAEAFIEKSKGFPAGRASTPNVRHAFNVARIERNFAATPDGLYTENPDFHSVQELLQAAADERRLPGGSLIKARELAARGPVAASGGWCAPSQTLYDLTADETLNGIIDLPTIGVPKGGINFTPGPDFSDLYTDAGFAQTEAEAIAGTTKNCVEVDCPDFGEVRLDAVGLCVKAPLLTMAAFPELVRRWIDGTTVANEHKVAARVITSMRTLLGSAIAPTLTGTPVTWSVLTAVELVIEGQRQAFRLSDSESLEVVVPRWVRVAIRADLANRMGIGADSVTNAQINQHFADRGAAVQFILNYLELSSPKTVSGFPSTFEVMVYPAGTFVKGQQSVVNLSTVYDTADLVTNVYTAAFVEDGVLVAKMKNGGARITIPIGAAGSITGMLGAATLNDTWGNAQS